MPDLTWTVLAELEPGANWVSTGLTTANLFLFEHHNPPRRALLQVAQTDGAAWLFEPRTLSSDRNDQLLLLDHAAIFGGERRLSLRYADPDLVVRNWTVKISAAQIALPVSTGLEPSLTVIATALTELQVSQASSNTQMAAKLEAILTAVSYPTPTPTPTPTPAPSNSAAGVAYVASQSSYYGGAANAATYEELTDGNGTTGTFTWGAGGWIQATFAQPVKVTAVQVGGGNLSGQGAVAGYCNGSKLQYSTDNTSWIDVWTVEGVSDSGANQFVTYSLTSPITAQYWRLRRTDADTGTSEFKFT